MLSVFMQLRLITTAWIQTDLDNLTTWSEKWRLLFKAETCIIFDPIIFDYSVGNSILKRVAEHRDLDALMTNNAKYHDHIYTQVNKAN